MDNDSKIRDKYGTGDKENKNPGMNRPSTNNGKHQNYNKKHYTNKQNIQNRNKNNETNTFNKYRNERSCVSIEGRE